MKGKQDTWLAGSNPLSDRCPLVPRIRRMFLGVTGPVLAPRIGVAEDIVEKMLKWGEGMEPHFISWNAAALHTFEFTFLDVWSRKMIKAIQSRKPEVSAGAWNDVYTPVDDKSRLKWPSRETVVILEVARSQEEVSI